MNLPCSYFLASFLINKHVLKDCTKSRGILLDISSLVLSIFSSIISMVILLVLWLYKSFVKSILLWKLGNNFYKMLNGCDLLCCISDDDERGVVTMLATFDSDLTPQGFFDSIKKQVQLKVFDEDKFSILRTARGCFLDYLYVKKIDLSIDDVVKCFPPQPQQNGYITKKDLLAYLNLHATKNMPKHNLGNFDVYVGTRMLTYADGSGLNQYPVIIRIHHCVADGLSIYNILREILCSKNDASKQYAIQFKKDKQRTNLKQAINTFRELKVHNLIPTSDKPNLLLDVNTSSDADASPVMTFMTERGEKYVNMVKRIKSRITGSSFQSVILAAYTASLTDFYIKKAGAKNVPFAITSIFPKQINFSRLTQSYGTSSPLQYGNDFTVMYFHLHLMHKERENIPVGEYIVERLILINKEMEKCVKSADSLINYVFLKTLLSLLPLSICNVLVSQGTVTLPISFLPGGPKMKSFNNHFIKDIVFTLPKLKFIGVALTALTYDNRFQFAIKGSSKTFSNIEEMELILEGIFKYLDVLDEKTKVK